MKSLPDIPPDIIEEILPPQGLSVSDFLAFPLPLISSSHPVLPASSYFSKTIPKPIHADFLRSTVIPNARIILELEETFHEAVSQGYHSVIYAHGSTSQRVVVCPLWTLTLWLKVLAIRTKTRPLWLSAFDWIQARRGKSLAVRHLVDDVEGILRVLPWGGNLSGFEIEPVECLCPYLSYDWLATTHESHLLKLLQWEILANPEFHACVIVAPSTTCKTILTVYSMRDQYLERKLWRWIRDIGDELATGNRNEFASIVHINGNHWIALIIDFAHGTISYGDPMGKPVPSNISDAMNWWVSMHSSKAFVTVTLLTTTQEDGHSCGLLAPNALSHHYLPATYPLADPNNIAEARMKAFLSVSTKHLDNLSTMTESTIACPVPRFNQLAKNTPFTFKSPAIRQRSASNLSDQYHSSPHSEGSDKSEGEDSGPELDAYPVEATPPPEDLPQGQRKRERSIPSIYTPPISPVKKRLKSKVSGPSTLSDNEPGTLLSFFRILTIEEKAANILEQTEASKMEKLEMKAKAAWVKEGKVIKKREQNRLRQQAKRDRDKEARDENPKKGKQRKLELPQDPSIDTHDSTEVPESSRPFRGFKELRQNSDVHHAMPPKKTTYTNWKSPFLWAMIEEAVCRVGRPWRQCDIVANLQRQNFKLFRNC